MKRISKFITGFLAIISIAFSVGLPKQEVPNVNDTWRVHVSTAAASVRFYNSSQLSSLSFGALNRFIDSLKKTVMDKFYIIAPMVGVVAILAALYFSGASPMLALGIVLLLSSFAAPRVSQNLHLVESIDISAVVDEFEAHYNDEGQNMGRLRKLIYTPWGTPEYFRMIPETNDTYKSVVGTHSEVLQGFQKAFVNKGTLTFTPHVTKLFKMMIDKSVYPDEFWPSYLGFFEQLEEADRSKWPFIRWLIEQHLIPRMKKDYEMQVAWNGEYSAPTADVPQDAADAADGLGKIREDLITAGRITPITTGALATDATDFVDQIEEFVADIDKDYVTELDFLFMNSEKELLYRRGVKEKYNQNYMQEPGLSSVALFPNLKVVGLRSMGSSAAIWSTTKENRIRPTSKADINNTMKVSLKDNKQVQISSSFRFGLGFEIPEFVFTNDQALSVFS